MVQTGFQSQRMNRLPTKGWVLGMGCSAGNGLSLKTGGGVESRHAQVADTDFNLSWRPKASAMGPA